MSPQNHIFNKGDLVAFYKCQAQDAPLTTLIADFNSKRGKSRGIVLFEVPSSQTPVYAGSLVKVFVDNQILTFHSRSLEAVNGGSNANT